MAFQFNPFTGTFDIVGAAGSVTIGGAVSGGSANRVLYIDGSGNLAQKTGFEFDGSVTPGLFKIGNGVNSYATLTSAVFGGAEFFPHITFTSSDGSESGVMGRGLILAGTASNPNPYLTLSDETGAVTFDMLWNVSTSRMAMGENIDFGSTSLTNIETQNIGITIDGAGSVITTGIKGDIVVPYKCTIQSWTLVGDQTGSIVIDVWKDTYANFPPTVADTITGSEVPSITTNVKNQDLSLSSWTTAVAAGDILRFNVNSATTLTRVHLSIKVVKS